ncbi:MAG: hypothetical protein HUU29_08310, partial [Planctomycetaceae bacterium]|nr:hypothetical protein [Planctomycetaceae bacterium]
MFVRAPVLVAQWFDDTNLMLSPPGTRIGPSNFPSGFIGGPNRWERSMRLSGYVTYSARGHSVGKM